MGVPWVKAVAAMGGVAVMGLGLGGLGGCACNPDEETCIYVRSYATQLAEQATICCTQPDPAACLNEVRKAEDTISKHIEEMRKACRDENWRRLKELKEMLPSILPKWFKPPIPTTPAPTPAPGAGGQKNAMALFSDGETVTVAAQATPGGVAASVGTVTINGTPYLPSAAGGAVLQSPASIAIAEATPEDSSLALTATDYTLSSGATITLSTTLGQVVYTMSGSFSLTSFETWQGMKRAIPSGASLVLTRGVATSKVSVDATHPNNMALYDPATGHGMLRFMATLSTTTSLEDANFTPIPKVWIEAPFEYNATTGVLDFAAAGATSGPAFFPAEALSQALMDGGPLPPAAAMASTGADCDDSDGDGIPNIAEALYEIYRTGFPGCNLGPLGTPH